MNAHMAITEPVTISLFEIQPEHETADEMSGARDGWAPLTHVWELDK